MYLRSHTVDSYQLLRYCRALAQTYHPDKQQDEERKAAAAASFMRIQEAYEASGCGIRAPRAWATTMMCFACSQHSVDVPHGHASGKSSACLAQVLIDPERRQVYDIYGKEGLEAGLEVGPHLRTRDELRRQWQQFQQQQVGWPAHGIAAV